MCYLLKLPMTCSERTTKCKIQEVNCKVEVVKKLNSHVSRVAYKKKKTGFNCNSLCVGKLRY